MRSIIVLKYLKDMQSFNPTCFIAPEDISKCFAEAQSLQGHQKWRDFQVELSLYWTSQSGSILKICYAEIL